MVVDREPVEFHAVLEECLEYPGTSYATISALFNSGQTTVGGWRRKRTFPKGVPPAKAVHILRAYAEECRQRGNDPLYCDAHWQRHVASYCSEHRETPEQFAASVGAEARYGRRWVRYGEVPIDAHRTAVVRRTGYNFDAQQIPRAVAAAQRKFGSALPAPLDAVCDAGTLRTAIVTIRERSGRTSQEIATRANVRQSQIESLGTATSGRLQYTVASIAALIDGLARFVRSSPLASEGTDGVVTALALLTERPPTPRMRPSRSTSVMWERIAERLRTPGDRHLGYRCTDGEPLPVAFVRFCIAFEQAALTTAEVIRLTGLHPNAISSWCNGRSFPDRSMIDAVQAATRALDDARRSGVRTPQRVPSPTPHPHPYAPAAHAPVSEPHVQPPPDDVMHDTGLAFATLGDAIAKAHAAGWRPSDRTRNQLVGAARQIVVVAGITADDLVRKDAVAIPGVAPALHAILGGVPGAAQGMAPRGEPTPRSPRKE